MVRGLYADQPERVTLHEVSPAALVPTQVRIRTTLAAIKHGTTFHLFCGKSPFQARRFDKELRLFVTREAPGTQGAMSATFVGNMVAGVVREVGPAVKKFKPGERVFCHGPACEEVMLAEDAVELAAGLRQSRGRARGATCPCLWRKRRLGELQVHAGGQCLGFVAVSAGDR